MSSPDFGPHRILPFGDVGAPWGVAVDGAGTVFVTHYERDPKAPPGLGVSLRAGVSRLTAGTPSPFRLPVDGLVTPRGIAIGADGTAYIADNNFHTIVAVAPGAGSATVLPSLGAQWHLGDVAILGDDLYLTLQPGITGGIGHGLAVRTPPRPRRFRGPKRVDLPVPVRFPSGIAVDDAGTVHVVDGRTVQALPRDAAAATTLPFGTLQNPGYVAVDANGSVHVTDIGADGGRVLRLAPGAATPEVLPFTGLRQPRGIAIDTAGTVYVADSGTGLVLAIDVH